MDDVFVKSSNPIPNRLTSPPPGTASENSGVGATPTSGLPPPNAQIVSGHKSASLSRLFTLAARPDIWMTVPDWYGISNWAGLLTDTAANLQEGSAMANVLVLSGMTDPAGVTDSVVASFVVIDRS